MPSTESQKRASSKWFKKQYTENRNACILLLGSQCRCGFSDVRALNIDHVNGGGTQEAKRFGGRYYKRILDKLKSGSSDYQLLCANCNQIKRHENKEF